MDPSCFWHKRFLGSIVPALVGTMLLLSCQPDMESIRALGNADSIPTLIANRSEVVYTENGLPVAKVLAPTTRHYQFAPEPYTEFPEGIKAYTFTEGKIVESYLTARYALYYEKKKLWDVRYNVVAMNRKGEILNTEQLFWDEIKKTVYSEASVKITTSEGVIFGEGFTADELLEDIVVKKSSGVLYVDEPN